MWPWHVRRLSAGEIAIFSLGMPGAICLSSTGSSNLIEGDHLPFRAANGPLHNARRIEKQIEPCVPLRGRSAVDRIVNPTAIYCVTPRMNQTSFAEDPQMMGKQVAGQTQRFLQLAVAGISCHQFRKNTKAVRLRECFKYGR